MEDPVKYLTRDLAVATQMLLQLAVRDIGQLTDLCQPPVWPASQRRDRHTVICQVRWGGAAA
jgi:hypothetical protein